MRPPYNPDSVTAAASLEYLVDYRAKRGKVVCEHISLAFPPPC